VCNGNYLHRSFLLRYHLLGFSVFCSLASTTAESRAEKVSLMYLLLNLILHIFVICKIHSAKVTDDT